jgi:hypothetical protein
MDPKVQAAGSAGAATTVIVFVAAQFGLEIPGEVGAAITALIATGAGYVKKR